MKKQNKTKNDKRRNLGTSGRKKEHGKEKYEQIKWALLSFQIFQIMFEKLKRKLYTV